MPDRTPSVATTDSEKRIRRIVYCAEQLMGKRVKLWQSRYERACASAESIEELDEALLRVHAKFPHIGLNKIIEEARGDATA